MLPPCSISGLALAEEQHNEFAGLAFHSFSSLAFQTNNSGSATPTPIGGNFSTYDNSTYGIKFQSPINWKKVEILSSDYTFIEFTSPLRNAASGPAQIILSIEKDLGNVTTVQQYDEAVNKLLHSTLGNFSTTAPRPTTLSGQPAIARVLNVKEPTSGIRIDIAQVFTIKNGVAYIITYTAPAPKYLSYLPIVQQILNSFQITK